MSRRVPDPIIHRWRCLFSDWGMPADDYTDDQIIREIALRSVCLSIASDFFGSNADPTFGFLTLPRKPDLITDEEERRIVAGWDRLAHSQLDATEEFIRRLTTTAPMAARPDPIPRQAESFELVGPDPFSVLMRDTRFIMRSLVPAEGIIAAKPAGRRRRR
jgi:hypothetical protein